MADHLPSLISIYNLFKKSFKNLAKCGMLILLNLQPAFLHCTGQLQGSAFLCYTLGSTKDLGITFTWTRGEVDCVTRD